MQIAAGPGQPVISSCQREAESTRNLGGMREGREGREGREEGSTGVGRRAGPNQLCVQNNRSASENQRT